MLPGSSRAALRSAAIVGDAVPSTAARTAAGIRRWECTDISNLLDWHDKRAGRSSGPETGTAAAPRGADLCKIHSEVRPAGPARGERKKGIRGMQREALHPLDPLPRASVGEMGSASR